MKFPIEELSSIGIRVLSAAVACSAAAILVALIAGCAGAIPDSIVAPPAAKTAARLPAMASNGTIFQADSFRPMFEDRRARLVGDTLVITISEKSTAGKNVDSSSSKDGAAGFVYPPFFGMVDIEGSIKSSNADKASANAANNFNTTLTVTVSEVLANGNLMVRGEKQIALDRGTEFIRFSGVVSPATISSFNTVASTQVADLRVEYRTNSNIDKVALQSALMRFFLSALPL